MDEDLRKNVFYALCDHYHPFCDPSKDVNISELSNINYQ